MAVIQNGLSLLRRSMPTSLKRYVNKRLRLDPLTVSREQAERFFSGENEVATAAIARMLPQGSVVFDIGANSGFFTWELCRQSKNSLTVTLFEPIPNLIRIAKEVVTDFPDCEFDFVNAAMGDASGEISLFIPNDGNIGWITSIAEKATSQDTIEVALLNIGPFLNERKPNFIKIDVEGAEAPILERIQDLISASYRPIILVEVAWGGTASTTWHRTLSALTRLAANGYEFTTLDHATETFSRLWHIDEVAALDRTQDFLLKPE